MLYVSQKVSNFLQGSWKLHVTMHFCPEPQNNFSSFLISHCSMCYSMSKIIRPKWLIIQNKNVPLSSKASISHVPYYPGSNLPRINLIGCPTSGSTFEWKAFKKCWSPHLTTSKKALTSPEVGKKMSAPPPSPIMRNVVTTLLLHGPLVVYNRHLPMK